MISSLQNCQRFKHWVFICFLLWCFLASDRLKMSPAITNLASLMMVGNSHSDDDGDCDGDGDDGDDGRVQSQ